MEYDFLYILFMSINLGFAFTIMLAACLCCRKKIPKNEFLGLEGMVKIKNPEENVENAETALQLDIISSSTGETDSKRASNAPHRSLPDIPITESINDNGSELYATVVDKIQDKPQGRSPVAFKKQPSVSQHSSISQADDISSPYARVKTLPHDYDKVRPAEHPYAQLNLSVPSTSTNQPIFENLNDGSISPGNSSQNLLTASEDQQEIPAASAIAGMVSASQELPYMTPPIVQQPHFSGDSQDSSKGYTSISVREPLANIIAQSNHHRHRLLTKDAIDSHYATVSDDSDEMYAAIDDPNNHADVYTSGSETYAQIQPTQPMTVAVEINPNIPRIPELSETSCSNVGSKLYSSETPIPPPVDSLRAQMHSRQASSSSNTSSIGILSSPKPEKRQANSPLPPTPKILQFNSNSNLTSTSSNLSGRNSVASVIEYHMPQTGKIISKENLALDTDDASSEKKNISPSKDIEGMYAKVMKKNRLSNVPSQNSSPIMNRKPSLENDLVVTNELSIKDFVPNAIQTSPGKISVKSATYIENNYETVDKSRPRSNSCSNKDHGYETIPADKTNGNNNNTLVKMHFDERNKVMKKDLLYKPGNLISDSPLDVHSKVSQFHQDENVKIQSEPGYESLPDESFTIIDHGYETLLKPNIDDAKISNSDYDPNYEMLQPGKYSNCSDDGYAKVFEKLHPEDDTVDGYSRVKEREVTSGYRGACGKTISKGKHHDYASISEAKKQTDNKVSSNNNNNNDEIGSDLYSSIPNEQIFCYLDTLEEYHNYQTISDAKQTASSTSSTSKADKLTTPSTGQSSPDMPSNTISSSQHQSNSNYESLTGSESDPNYESVRYLIDSGNPYEPLHNDSNVSPDIPGNSIGSSSEKSIRCATENSKLPAKNENGEVDDYFQV